MTNTVEIRMTARGYEVACGPRTVNFPSLEAAFGFAHERLERAREIRDLSDRCE